MIPPRLGLTMEFSVAHMLIVLGAINLTGVTSLVSIALGLFLAYRIGVADGLFSSTPHLSPR